MASTTKPNTSEKIDLLSLFLEQAPLGVVIVDKAYRFVKLSEDMALINGRSVQDHIGKRVSDIVSPESWSHLRPIFDRALSGETILDIPLSGTTLAHPSREVHVVASYFPLSRNGEVHGVGVIMKDITERKRAEAEARLYEERLEQAQWVGEIGVFDWNIAEQTIWYSPEDRRLLEIPEDAPATLEAGWDHVHPDDRDGMEHLLKTSLETSSDFSAEFRVVRTNGGIRWLRAQAKCNPGPDGKPARMLGVHYEITDQKLTEESSRFMAEAGKVLSSSLDYRKTLNMVVRLAVPHIADWCSVDMMDEKGNLQLLALSHKDPDKVRWAKELRRRKPVDMSATTGSAHVARTGQTEFIPVITDDMLVHAAKDKHELTLLRQIGFHSVIITPIRVRNRTLGVLTLVSTESKRTFTRLDVATAEQLAARASLAIENAMLYEDVEKERQRLKELVASVPGVVWEAYGKPDEASQRINFVSDYVEKMLGYTVQEWLETPNFWLSIVHPDDKQIAAEEALKKFRDDAESANRFRWIAKSGKLVWVEAHSRAITDKKGKKVGMRGVTMDVTERIELERRKDEFISIASHELKTPITSIKVFNQLLQKKFKEDDQASRYLNRMNVQIDKLTTLISDLLDVSKIQAGKLELRKEPLRLDSLVREIAETIDATAQNHHVEVRGSVSREVYADHDRIGQVIVNMLTNAIKYSPDSEKVVVTMSETADGATVSVTDYGVGIPDEHKDKIFERFYRVYDTRDKTFPGLGMGLYISEVIVRRHDGKMWFESTSGSGSTFHFRIPFPPRKSKSRT